MTVGVRLLDFADTVIDDQPSVRGQNGRRAAADLEPLPCRNRRCQPMMKIKRSGTKWLMVKRHLAVRNPDALFFDIHLANCRTAGCFLGASAWKERPVQQGQLRLSSGIGYDGWEEASILIVYVTEFDAVVRRKFREPKALPVEDIFRHCQRNARTMGRPRRVSHQISLKRLNKRNAWILTAATAIGPALVVSFRLQCDS